jgi:predicted outer membrane protein
MRTLRIAATVVLWWSWSGCTRTDGVAGPVSSPFGDDQVVGLAVVVTDHQVQTGQAALDRGAKIPEVVAYAMNVIAEQTAARDRLVALAAAQGLRVDQTTIEARTNLVDTMMDVGNFQNDSQYLADSVHDIGKAVEIFDNTLLPLVRNPALRAELTATRELLANELAAGQQVLKETGIPPKAASLQQLHIGELEGVLAAIRRGLKHVHRAPSLEVLQHRFEVADTMIDVPRRRQHARQVEHLQG